MMLGAFVNQEKWKRLMRKRNSQTKSSKSDTLDVLLFIRVRIVCLKLIRSSNGFWIDQGRDHNFLSDILIEQSHEDPADQSTKHPHFEWKPQLYLVSNVQTLDCT